jgi:hypothetical protein
VNGGVLAPVSVMGVWNANEVSNTARYVENVAPMAHDPAIQSALTDKITKQATAHIQVQALANQAAGDLASRGLARVATLLRNFSGSLAGAVGGFIRSAVARIVASPTAAKAWVQVNQVAHAELVKAYPDRG